MAQQLRVYTMKDGKLDDWVGLFERKVAPLRKEQGFDIDAWAVPSEGKFVWLVSYDGDEAAFEAADKAYYELDAHKPLHEEATRYLASGESFFLAPVRTPA